MPSAARTKLDARLTDIQDILDAHAAAAGGGRGRKWKVSALNKGSLVLLTAHLEGFLEDLYKEAVDGVVAARVASARVPDRLKLTALRKIAADIRSAGNPAKRDEHTLRLFKKAARLGHPRTRVSPQDVDTPSVLNTFGNPRAAAIDALFANLGLDDILTHVHWRRKGAAAVRTDIESLVNKRNQIAHGELGATVGKGEIRSYLDLIKRVADCLDLTVGTHVVGITGAALW